MAVTVLGIDLAKNVFALHGVDQKGNTVLCKPKLSRARLLETVANMPPCLIAMEACSGAHTGQGYSGSMDMKSGSLPLSLCPLTGCLAKKGKMTLLTLRLSVKQYNVLTCGLSASSLKLSNLFSVCTGPGRA